MTPQELVADVRAFVARAESLSGWIPPAAPSLPAHIAGWISDRIQFGDFKPGEPIRELAVADHFDVSRGPVRDAFRLLDRDGLLVLTGRKGAQARAFSPEETEAVFRIRAEIFAHMCRLAAGAPARPPVVVDGLCMGAVLLTRLAATPDVSVGDYILTRRGIWLLIAALAGNGYLARMSSGLEREIAALWASVQDPGRRQVSASAWVDLCDAMVDGRGEEAETRGRALVLAGLESVLRHTAVSRA